MVALRTFSGPAPGNGIMLGLLALTYIICAGVLVRPSTRAYLGRGRS